MICLYVRKNVHFGLGSVLKVEAQLFDDGTFAALQRKSGSVLDGIICVTSNTFVSAVRNC
jgi:hypothetical protein